jgi:hypothetical protein
VHAVRVVALVSEPATMKVEAVVSSSPEEKPLGVLRRG